MNVWATRAKEYERRAEEAEQLAEQTKAAGAKQVYLDIARHWRLLASQVGIGRR